MSTLEEIIAHLSGTLGVHVSSAVPRERPDEFVTVERTGGQATRHIDSASMTVQVWARGREACERLAGRTLDAILSSPDAVTDIMRADASMSWYPETASGSYWPRYVINATVHRGR